MVTELLNCIFIKPLFKGNFYEDVCEKPIVTNAEA
jgi:hypothetical protein